MAESADPAGLTAVGLGGEARAVVTARAVERFVVILVPFWLGLIVALGQLLGTDWATAAMAASVAVAVGGYAWYLASRPNSRPWRLVAAQVASLTALTLTSPGGVHVGTVQFLGNWMALTMVTAGGLLVTRRALRVCAGVSLLVVAAAWASSVVTGEPLGAAELLRVVLPALVDGVGMVVVVAALKGTATWADQVADQAREAAAVVMRRGAAEAEAQWASRMIQDTAVNTLAAVGMLGRGDREALAQRCAADLGILDSIGTLDIRDPRKLLDSAAQRAHVLQFHWTCRLASWGRPSIR